MQSGTRNYMLNPDQKWRDGCDCVAAAPMGRTAGSAKARIRRYRTDSTLYCRTTVPYFLDLSTDRPGLSPHCASIAYNPLIHACRRRRQLRGKRKVGRTPPRPTSRVVPCT
mgnify:CR=1 FL=1